MQTLRVVELLLSVVLVLIAAVMLRLTLQVQRHARMLQGYLDTMRRLLGKSHDA